VLAGVALFKVLRGFWGEEAAIDSKRSFILL